VPSTQPAGLDRGFIDTVVFGLLTSGEAADAATDWAGRPLADGVARVLYLSGKAPTKDDLGAFTADFVAEHNLTSGNVVAFLDGWHDRIGVCRDFRVRDVRSATKIEAILACDKKKAWDTALTVGGAPSHRIAWTEVSSPSSSPAPGPQHQQCLNACSKEEGLCMATAHSAPERQVCIKEMTLCKKECK